MGSRRSLSLLISWGLFAGTLHSQSTGNRLEQLLFHSPAGDTLLQVRFHPMEDGRQLRSHYDGQGFLTYRAIAGAEAGLYLGAAGDTLYRSRLTQAGDSVRIALTDALGRVLDGASYPGAGGPSGSYTVRPDSLVGETTFRYVMTPDNRTDSIYVRQGDALTHIVKAVYGTDAGIGKPALRSGVIGFRHSHPGRVVIRFAAAKTARRIAADLHRLDGARVAKLMGNLAAGQADFVLDIGSFPGRVPAGVYAVRFHLGTEELFRFRLTRP